MACHCVTMAGAQGCTGAAEDECLDEDEDNNFEVGEAMAPESFEMFLGFRGAVGPRRANSRVTPLSR